VVYLHLLLGCILGITSSCRNKTLGKISCGGAAICNGVFSCSFAANEVCLQQKCYPYHRDLVSEGFVLQVFMFDEWAKHRSTARYWRHIKGLFECVSLLFCPHNLVPFWSANCGLGNLCSRLLSSQFVAPLIDCKYRTLTYHELVDICSISLLL
jgi:hypothetical protein